MKTNPSNDRIPPTDPLSRRAFVQKATAIAVAAVAGTMPAEAADAPKAGPANSATPPTIAAAVCPHPYITPAKDFYDVSRGNPKPYTLTGIAQAEARLTPETWRLEITADSIVEEPIIRVPATMAHPRTLAEGTAIDLPTLLGWGAKHEVKFLKAMQCLNIDTPLGQGLWAGVPLRDLLLYCGKMSNVRRIYYWGYHNNDPKQMFQSSLSYTQVMETPPGELPAFIAYRLNGEPISPQRGGPVRMVVPWAHGFKSIKWLQHIFLTNDFRANDTYAHANNDPESFLKTAAYLDEGPEKINAREPVVITGQVICGLSGLKRVEYWVRPVGDNPPKLADDDPELLRGPWLECELQDQPDWNQVLPAGVSPRDVLGFDKTTGKPMAWPLRYSMVSFSTTLRDLKPGRYEVRARAVDLNDFAQPEPRPAQKTGMNALQVRRFQIG
jgi:hypothetical protein